MIRELCIPPETDGDEHATEMLRVWLAHEEVHVSMLLGMWEDAEECDIDEREAWGNLLADIARHIAHGMQQSHAWEKADTLRKIRDAFLENVDLQERRIEGRYHEN